MTLGKIHPQSRGVLRLHGWLLMLWALAVGGGVNWLLREVLHLSAFSVRYALNAGAIYFVGFVVGGWYYLRWWNAQPPTHSDRPVHATPADELAYQVQEQAREKKLSWLRNFDGLSDFGLGDGCDPLSFLLLMVVVLLLAVGLLVFLGYLPLFLTEALGGYLAEIVLEFVIGAVLLRRVVQPRPEDDYWGFAVRKTWIYGVLFVVVAAVLGWIRDMA